MPNRVVNIVEKNIRPQPAKVATVPANASFDVLADISTNIEEFSGRYVQNLTGADIYYAFGQDCDNAEAFHGLLQDKQQLDCSNHGARVSVWSAGGGKVAVTILRRKDMINQETIFQAPNVLAQKTPYLLSVDADNMTFFWEEPNPEGWVIAAEGNDPLNPANWLSTLNPQDRTQVITPFPSGNYILVGTTADFTTAMTTGIMIFTKP